MFAVPEPLNATSAIKHPHMMVSGCKKQHCIDGGFMNVRRGQMGPLISSQEELLTCLLIVMLEKQICYNFLVQLLFIKKPQTVSLDVLFILQKEREKQGIDFVVGFVVGFVLIGSLFSSSTFLLFLQKVYVCEEWEEESLILKMA